MSKYLLIESRDPYESGDADFIPSLAARLSAKGREVTILLVQNGVLPARTNAERPHLRKALDAGVTVLADSFSLSERGIQGSDIDPTIRPVQLDVVVDAMADGTKTIWH
jgi:sulfur transfer complex TusBCD TusB component (DsrH family)